MKLYSINSEKSEYKYLAVALTVVATVIMAIAVMLYFMPRMNDAQEPLERIFFTTAFSLLLVPVGLYFGLKKRYDLITLGFILVMTAAAIAVRLALFDYASGDYRVFLKPWTKELAMYPGISRWLDDLGDYNMPYIYILTLISKLPFSWLYQIKLFSVGFDFLLAYYVMKCASIFIKSEKKLLMVFLLVLFWPTCILNSSYWAQCDAVYVSLCLAGVYYAVTSRAYLSVSMFALALSFKLQTIFILPIIVILMLRKKIDFKHLLAFPVVFFGILTPALIAGKPFIETISIYAAQTTTYSSLTLGAPSMYCFVGGLADYDTFKGYGIMCAGVAILAILYFCYIKREYIGNKEILLLAFLFASAVPYLLPDMHERYFFMADFFAFLPFAVDRKKWYITAIMELISIQSYSKYLFGMTYIPFELLSLALLTIIVINAYSIFKSVSEKEKSLKTA